MIKGETFERVQVSEKQYEELVMAEKTVKSAKILRRVHAFKLMHMDWKYREIAKFLGVTNDTITDWIGIYKSGGIPALLNLHCKGRQSLLKKRQVGILKKESEKGSFKTAKQAKKFIENNFGVSYHLHHVQLLLKKGFAYPLREPEESLENHLL